MTIERPEEAYDPRTLYERLKEQKDRKQEEFLEQLKFSKCTLCVWLETRSHALLLAATKG